ncbi:uncharacterized protein PRCAT00002690001 [Priceomyces carsonii]|uniref:uncharacterized protein n=1 Tax=Priceomyces carsonii TaxID=28549 RepID=UPI002ED787FC|nr:unnamed protein product [Priceomyces carsonii]
MKPTNIFLCFAAISIAANAFRWDVKLLGQFSSFDLSKTNINEDKREHIGDESEKKIILERPIRHRSILEDLLKSLKVESESHKRTQENHCSKRKDSNQNLRIKSNLTQLGVDKVKQYAGYLDTDDNKKHFFFGFLNLETIRRRIQ